MSHFGRFPRKDDPDPSKYRVTAIGVDKAVRWHLQEIIVLTLVPIQRYSSSVVRRSHPVTTVPSDSTHAAVSTARRRFRIFRVAWDWLLWGGRSDLGASRNGLPAQLDQSVETTDFA